MTKPLPQPVAAYFQSTAIEDKAAFLDVFAEDAIVVDEGKVHAGKTAIESWGIHSHLAANLRFVIRQVEQTGNLTSVTAEIDGDFDKTGLPDPLLLSFHFTVNANVIALLVIQSAHQPLTAENIEHTEATLHREEYPFAQAAQDAVDLRRLYHQIEQHRQGSIWSLEEDMLGLVSDIGVLSRLVLAVHGRWPYNDEVQAELSDKLAECIWWLLVLADRLELDSTIAYTAFVNRLAREVGGIVGRIPGNIK